MIAPMIAPALALLACVTTPPATSLDARGPDSADLEPAASHQEEAPLPPPPPPPPPLPPPPPPQFDFAQIDAAVARLPPGPSLDQVQRAALDQAQLGPRVGQRWLRRARVAAALPSVSVQVDQRLDQGWNLDREVGEADALRRDAGQQAVIRAKATWELDRLVFAPDELRAARAVLDLADARERILVEVTRLFFERQRILLERELAPPADLDAALSSSLRLLEIEGLLEALTGLEFGPRAQQ